MLEALGSHERPIGGGWGTCSRQKNFGAWGYVTRSRAEFVSAGFCPLLTPAGALARESLLSPAGGSCGRAIRT